MVALITNPEEKKQISKALQEISNSLSRISSERSLIKETKDLLLEEHKDKLTMKQINKLAKTYHHQSFKKENAEFDEFLYLYETVTGEKLDD